MRFVDPEPMLRQIRDRRLDRLHLDLRTATTRRERRRIRREMRRVRRDHWWLLHQPW